MHISERLRPPGRVPLVTASLVHLVRHGEVDNPHHVVYADLPGYGLTATGRRQADDCGRHLASRPIVAVISSPLLRATQTAAAIAALHGLDVVTDDQLIEWTVAMRWAGVRWDNLEDVFPDELAAYIRHPYDLPFAAESLHDLGERIGDAVRRAAAIDGGEIVIVSHQDPIHAASLHLTGVWPDDYHDDKPQHCGVVTLEPSPAAYRRVAYWAPPQGIPFPPPT